MLGNDLHIMTVLVEDNRIIVKGIDYALSFYHTYLLPLFKLDYKDERLVFTKQLVLVKASYVITTKKTLN